MSDFKRDKSGALINTDLSDIDIKRRRRMRINASNERLKRIEKKLDKILKILVDRDNP